jgi:hypothetical protein
MIQKIHVSTRGIDSVPAQKWCYLNHGTTMIIHRAGTGADQNGPTAIIKIIFTDKRSACI